MTCHNEIYYILAVEKHHKNTPTMQKTGINSHFEKNYEAVSRSLRLQCFCVISAAMAKTRTALQYVLVTDAPRCTASKSIIANMP
jgi:hypothetical protein